ncbi:septum formation protein Maf [Notoacmeibacter marinus]|uniref:dTTP/UTP pyrophosphatase n=1 Tax=Notoacmeibacter marinus TaxID=1876515 RepID=A0A231V099_9HYPH|nr:Maf-like protein [Notoacmeibacter marinus]OXT01618.1 septum formation protein Maf [Notoacmeibacter marinus]
MSVLQKLILASGSPRRVELLQQAGIEPDSLLPTEIDETPRRAEHPRSLAKRLSVQKAEAAFEAQREQPEQKRAFILAADTVVSVGQRILPKTEMVDEASSALRLLSGRSHRVHSGICLVTPKGQFRQRMVESRVRFKRLGAEEIEAYLASGEWRGKAGGYAIQGLAGTFVIKLVGSYSNVVGLPLYETVSLLVGEGFHVHQSWLGKPGRV